MNETPIQVTQTDFDRLGRLLDGWWAPDARTQPLLDRLQEELDRARVVANGEVDPDCITLGSEVVLRDLDTGWPSIHRLVWPNDAAGSHKALSILSPIGVAALGYREGDEFVCETPGGLRRLRVEKVLFQPECASQAEEPVF